VRRALRKFRDSTALSQGDVAKKLGWSLSKVQRIEGGEVSVSPTDLRALLELYDVSAPALVTKLMEDGRVSRRQRYETAPEYRAYLTPGLLELMQFEQRAVAIRTYQSIFLPGILQTPAVARVVLGYSPEAVSDKARRVRFEVRMARRALVELDGAPQYFVILDESVIKRRIGDTGVMAEQLEYLDEIGRRDNVHIRIVPLAKGGRLGMLGPFWTIDLDDEGDDSMLYRETYTRDEVVHASAEVAFHRNIFESFWRESLSEEATRSAIVAEAATLRAALHRDH